jgi:hypothetical protein
MAGQMAHSNNMLSNAARGAACSQEPLQRNGNFSPGVSGFAVTPLQGNPDGHGKAPMRQ